ncbi:MAG: tRNA-dependent cyclodipeptide synthase [Gammaproteobacteria bacterium]|nr:tRNA-dependent cyclodipeptide synthase [Gammaproteobacteria bacterium]
MKKAHFRYNGKNIQIPDTENKKAIFLISIGQSYHESKYLSATINLINKANFNSCTIALADVLQRHNYSLTHPQDVALQIAIENGHTWRDRNSNILNMLNTKNEIVSWDTWLKHPLYPSFRKEIDDTYYTNPCYKNAVNNTADIFLSRFSKRESNIKQNFDQSLCLEYIKEECAIIMPLWAHLDYDFIIYPKPMTSAMENTHEIFLKEKPHQMHWLSLHFKS